ncbi:T-complex protein 11-domain-containing protein [Xylariomycetidae sp. FL2044]|nr:T-complex protein 11-domain-containing protein [Xylariomycetidae sp. FL2044]
MNSNSILATMHRASEDLTDPDRNLEESLGTADDMIMINAEEEDNRIYTPPPRIAARFSRCRPTQNRRKDSAASSRRNSISSAHSRSSHNLTQHGGPQSKYIAQQIRRASILEDRKARLADRAAHAEKVRLRAAAAKAAHQTNSNSEERALAAQQAREKNLAEIVATCAEEVKRAKAVAESMKEKREQELRKHKLQMEERMAEAQKRRELLLNRQRRSRAQSAATKKSETGSSTEEEGPESSTMSDDVIMTDDAAASKIQWWWRVALRKKTVREFAELGLNIDGVRETSFEKVVELLGQERVLAVTARILRLCGLEEGDVGSVDEMAAVRTFLSAFLILGHPTQVLSNKDHKGEQEQDLVAKARDLLISFENKLSGLTLLNNYTTPPASRRVLSEAYATFHNAFIAWKARDSNALVEVMILQFVELDAILQTVKDRTEEAVTESYRQSIEENQLMLLVRIKKLAGAQQGKKMVFDAVKQARKARAAKKPAGDTKPRAADHALGSQDSIGDPAAGDHLVSEKLQTLTPPTTPLHKQRSTPAGDGPPLPTHAQLLPDNRVVVHELAINREFRLDFAHFQAQRKARMDFMLNDLKNGPQAEEKEFFWLTIMFSYMKERLQHLVKPGLPMHTFIGEIFDTEVAQRQFLAGSFSYERFFESLGSLLPKLCAPVRDAEVKYLVENKLCEGHVSDRLEALMSFIDVMLCDYANWCLQIAAPELIKHGTSYETQKFAAELDKGTVTLAHAEASWRTARNKVHAEIARRDPEGINHPRSRPTPDKIYWQMLLDEFTQPSPPPETIPEPLALDADRRARLGKQTIRIVTAGAILLQCKNILKRDVRAPWKTEVGRIFTVFESMDDKTKPLSQSTAIHGIMAALEAGRSMPTATKTHLQALVTKVLGASIDAQRDNADPREPVLRLLLTRLRGHILARLQAGSASEKVKATSTAGEKLASLGLPEFVERVREVVDEIVRVGVVDRDTHGVWWESVAEKVESSP